jgi:hypothetical protein
MPEWSRDQIEKGLKEAFDAQKAQGNYEYVPAGTSRNGEQLYKKQVQRSGATDYWDAQMSAYYFSIGR